jgi:hypothetical protein
VTLAHDAHGDGLPLLLVHGMALRSAVLEGAGHVANMNAPPAFEAELLAFSPTPELVSGPSRRASRASMCGASRARRW